MTRSRTVLYGLFSLLIVFMVGVGCNADPAAIGDMDGDIIPCIDDEDCPVRHDCIMAAGGTKGICMPESQSGCDSCDPALEVCINEECQDKYPACSGPGDSACWDCQTCDSMLNRCVGEPCLDVTEGEGDADTVEEDKIDDPAEEGDLPPVDQAEEQTDQPPLSCGGDADCANGMICGPNRVCVPGCETAGCGPDEGTCNTATHRCEYCDPPCLAGEACNFNYEGWYCDAPCTPPCPEGFVCSSSTCVQLRCQTCPEPTNCYECNATTAYLCEHREDRPGCGGGGDTESVERLRSNGCLPANEECTEGVSDCCSGTCLMGYCL
jgi:hypothetical protein